MSSEWFILDELKQIRGPYRLAELHRLLERCDLSSGAKGLAIGNSSVRSTNSAFRFRISGLTLSRFRTRPPNQWPANREANVGLLGRTLKNTGTN